MEPTDPLAQSKEQMGVPIGSADDSIKSAQAQDKPTNNIPASDLPENGAHKNANGAGIVKGTTPIKSNGRGGNGPGPVTSAAVANHVNKQVPILPVPYPRPEYTYPHQAGHRPILPMQHPHSARIGLQMPMGPVPLTSAIAASLGLSAANFAPNTKIELVHLHVVKVSSPANGGTGAESAQYDVLIGSPQPYAQTVAVYNNQYLIWQGGSREREEALANLKTSTWNDFVSTRINEGGVSTRQSPHSQVAPGVSPRPPPSHAWNNHPHPNVHPFPPERGGNGALQRPPTIPSSGMDPRSMLPPPEQTMLLASTKKRKSDSVLPRTDPASSAATHKKNSTDMDSTANSSVKKEGPKRQKKVGQQKEGGGMENKKNKVITVEKYPATLDAAVSALSTTPLSWERYEFNLTDSDYKNLAGKLAAEVEANKSADGRLNGTSEANGTKQASSIDILLPGPASVMNTGSRGGTRRGSGKAKKEKETSAEEWVQCDSCSRWRLLPPPSNPLYPKVLPERWVCTMNRWNTAQASCSVPEETSTASEISVQRAMKLRVWVKRLRSADRYESKVPKSTVNESRTFGEVDWIRCSNPSCGKWRACARSIDGKALRRKYPEWFCWMNSWDEAKSSCNAPQEGTAVHSLAEKLITADPEEDDFTTGEQDDEDDGGSDGTLTLQGISSRGRIVRSRWNVSRRNRR